MPPYALHPPELRGRVFRGCDAVAAGLLTERQLRGASWRRLVRGTYAEADLPLTHGLQIAAARLVLPPAAVIAGRSAAWTYGAKDLVGAGEPVEVLVPRAQRFGPVAGLGIHTVTTIPGTDVTSTRLTTRMRTTADLLRWAPDVVEAVVRLDQILRIGLAPDTWRAHCRAMLRGAPAAIQAVGLADARAESPQESRLRVRLVLGGLPAPTPQFVVRHEGHFVARVDLAYPQRCVAVEYDGRWHADHGQLGRDRHRLNRLIAAGWRVVHVTAEDMLHLEEIIMHVRRLLAI